MAGKRSATSSESDAGLARVRTRRRATSSVAPTTRRAVAKEYGARAAYTETKYERERRERREQATGTG